MVNIVQSTVRANIFETLYDVFTSSLSAGTVTAAYIDDDHTFPQVVINPASLMIKKIAFGRDNREYTADIEVDIFATKAEQIDDITDEINADLETNASALAGSGLYYLDSEDVGKVTFPLNESTKVHQKTLLLNFQVNL